MLGHDLAFALPELQAQSESMMVDLIRVEKLGEAVFNPATGTTTRPVLATIYGAGSGGKARIQAVKEPADVEIAEDQATVQRYTVSVPVTVTGLEPGLVLTVTYSEDPDINGRTLLVGAVQGGTYVTSRRFVATDQQ